MNEAKSTSVQYPVLAHDTQVLVEVTSTHTVGAVVGAALDVGKPVGVAVGATVGSVVGLFVGSSVGASVGVATGEAVGGSVGKAVGSCDGMMVGASDGTDVGAPVGAIVVAASCATGSNGGISPPGHSAIPTKFSADATSAVLCTSSVLPPLPAMVVRASVWSTSVTSMPAE